mgnify:FL=1
MKSIEKLFVLLIFSCLLILPNVYAKDNYLNVSDNTNKSVEHSMFTAGDDVSTNNNIKGIDFTAGNNLSINGSSEYGLIAGNSINFKGLVTRDLFIAGNQIVVDSNANLARDLYVAGNKVTVSADIKGNIFLVANEVIIDSKKIDGDITLSGGKLTISNDTKINGTLKYNDNIEYSKTNASINKVKTYHVEEKTKDEISSVSDVLLKIITSFIVALVIYILVPATYNVLDDVKKDNILKTFGKGFLFLIAVPIISILLMVSIICLPLGMIALLLYGMIIYLSSIISSVYFGKLIGSRCLKLDNVYLQILIGIIITTLIKLIPMIGGLYSIIIIILGVGLIYNILTKLRYKTNER